MPQETKAKFTIRDEESFQDLQADASDPVALRKAIECAVDYRGDVTVTRTSTDAAIECYIFDLKHADDPSQSLLRAIPKNEDARIAIPLNDVASIRFTGRDTAAGKSFETWMKKYVAKKLAGERANIESEPLDG